MLGLNGTTETTGNETDEVVVALADEVEAEVTTEGTATTEEVADAVLAVVKAPVEEAMLAVEDAEVALAMELVI